MIANSGESSIRATEATARSPARLRLRVESEILAEQMSISGSPAMSPRFWRRLTSCNEEGETSIGISRGKRLLRTSEKSAVFPAEIPSGISNAVRPRLSLESATCCRLITGSPSNVFLWLCVESPAAGST